jgi:hypothetical protein
MTWVAKSEKLDRGAVAPSAAKADTESGAVAPSAAKADTETKVFIAAVNRCATQKQGQSRVFQRTVKPHSR